MEIVSNKINQIATTQVCEGVINTYTYSQDVGQPVINIRIETLRMEIKLLVLIIWELPIGYYLI